MTAEDDRDLVESESEMFDGKTPEKVDVLERSAKRREGRRRGYHFPEYSSMLILERLAEIQQQICQIADAVLVAPAKTKK